MQYLTSDDWFLSLLWGYLLFENACYMDKRNKWQKQPMICLIINASKTPWYDFKQYYALMWWTKMIDFKLNKVALKA